MRSADADAGVQGQRPWPSETIRRKRDGLRLECDEILAFITDVTTGAIGDAQIAAFTMAVWFRGMDLDERVDLTLAMARSGRILTWSGLNGPVLDKHSTGGVGDKVSLILAPAIAACGGFVPMISGRGLGHTGGTLDKLDSIPGYDSQPDPDRLVAAVRAAGCAIVGAGADLAPADSRLYRVRDITATVDSVALITASILSKKLAAGLDGLVMDVKFGNGAFMSDRAEAKALADSLEAVARRAGLPTRAVLSDMNQVLGRSAGNALEVAEAVDVLTGRSRDARLHGVTRDLAAELLVLGGLAADIADGAARFDRALASGAAAERFRAMVTALGGAGGVVDDPWRVLPRAPVVAPVAADRAGVVVAMDTRALGLAVVGLGGGRLRAGDQVDPRVGLSEVAALGEAVGPNRPLALVHAADAAGAAAASAAVRAAMVVG